MPKRKYRRPDGSTYEQWGGPKSRQDVEVKDEPNPSPSPSSSPSPNPSPSPSAQGVRQPTTSREWGEEQKRKKADSATERAEDAAKIAPWLLEEPTESEGGIGGAAAKAVSAAEAGDALAKAKKHREELERKKKQQKKEGEE